MIAVLLILLKKYFKIRNIGTYGVEINKKNYFSKNVLIGGRLDKYGI